MYNRAVFFLRRRAGAPTVAKLSNAALTDIPA